MSQNAKLEGGFSLVALLDGSTINGLLRVEGTPLVQRYNRGTSLFVTNFESLSADKRPTAVVILRDGMTGDILVPVASTLVWKYNGVPITFGEDGVSNNEGMVGMFKKLPSYPAVIGAQTHNLPALRVMKNLVPISGYDNDRLSLSGSVEVSGRSIPFQELSKEIIIQETTGNSYDVVISDDKGSALTEPGEKLTCTATLYKDGIEVTDYTGFTFQWVKLLGKGDENWGTNRTQDVSTNDIDNVLKVRCDVIHEGGVIVSGLAQISDFSDPYYVDFQITGITGNGVRKGQTAMVKPVARKRSDGSINAAIKNWNFNIKNNAGADFTITGKTGATFAAESVQVTYTDLEKAGGGLSGSVSTTY